MTYYPGDDPDVAQPWFLKKRTWIIAAVVFCLLALGLGIFTYVGMRRIPEIGGGLTIEADPDTRIYVGDNQVGTTKVTFTWEELFGDKWHNAIAVELATPTTAVTLEQLSGPGAVQLEAQGLSGGSMGTMGLRVGGSGFQYLIRRASGELDQVMGIIIDWAPTNERPRRYLLPVRLRKGEGASTVFFNSSGWSSSSGGGGPSFVRAFGQSPIEVKKSYRFSAGTAPTKFAEEIKSKGLWEPAGHE